MSSKTPSVSQVENQMDVEKTHVALSDDNVLSDKASLSALPLGQDWTEAEEKALVRKLDIRIIPMMALVFAISLLDRANISAAYISGMNKDLAMNKGMMHPIKCLS